LAEASNGPGIPPSGSQIGYRLARADFARDDFLVIRAINPPRRKKETPPLPSSTQSVRALLGATALLAVLSHPARASVGDANAASPFEAGQTLAGNYLSAVVASEDKDTSGSSFYFRESLRGDPRNLDLLERAFASALADGDVSGGFTLADRMITRDPGNSLARLALAVRAISDGQYAAARTQLSAGDAGHARDVTSSLLAAWAWAGAGDLRHALEAVDKGKDVSVAVFRDYHAGLIADVLGNPIEAQRRLKAAYDGEKNTLRVADAYGRFLSRHGDIEGAKKVYSDFLRLLPNHPLVKAALADLAQNKPLAPAVHNPREGAAEVLYGLGSAGTRQGDELAPLIYLRLALFLRPDHDLAAITVASLFEDLKQGEAAIHAYESVPPNSPMRENSDIQAALELDALGRTDEATVRMQTLVAAHPKDPEAWSALGSLQRSAKKFEDAAKSYDKAIDLVGTPDRAYWTLFYFRGICFERSKQWPKAEADFKTALELYPEQPLVLNYLGYSWVDQGMNLDEAFKMLRRAVELKPTDGYVVDSLGWADYKLGHYAEAVDELEKAVELKPADPVVNDHLGDAYWRVDRKNEAHFQWNHARDMGPEEEDKPAILKKIEAGLPDLPAAAASAAPPTPAPALAPAAKDGG
jgi:tetratricopeptide (TPR) repeat protein